MPWFDAAEVDAAGDEFKKTGTGIEAPSRQRAKRSLEKVAMRYESNRYRLAGQRRPFDAGVWGLVR